MSEQVSNGKVLSILQRAIEEGVELYLEGEQLRFRARGAGLSDGLRAALKEQRAAVIAFLQRKTQQATQQIMPNSALHAPLSPAQNRLLYLKLAGQGAQYNMAIQLQFSAAAKIEPARLEHALTQLIARHAILRTTFGDQNGGQDGEQQRITPLEQIKFRLPQQHLKSQAQLQEALVQQASLPFALERDLMLRAHFFTLPEQGPCLLLVLHHIAFDGWSFAILLRELAALYQGQHLSAPALQYADVAHWWAQAPQQQRAALSRTWWQEKMRGVAALNDFPPDFARPRQADTNAAHFCSALDAALLDNLRRLAAQQGVSLFAFLYSAFALVLARWAGRSETVIGTAVAGRDMPQVQDMLGFFVNTVPLRQSVDLTQSFSALLQDVANNLRTSFAHQDVPLEQIVADCISERDPSYAPLLQTYFAVEDNPPLDFEMAGFPVNTQAVARALRKFDLECSVQRHEQSMQLEINYAPSLYAASTIEEFALTYQHFLSVLPSQMQRPLQEIALCSAASWQAQLSWNPPSIAAPVSNVVTQFLQQVARTPQAIAYVDQQQRCTYHELAQRSAALAQHIQTICAGQMRDKLIGIALGTPFESLLAVLAILRAGAAYLPLDPSYPVARLLMITELAQPTLVLGDAQTPAEIAALPQFQLFPSAAQLAQLPLGKELPGPALQDIAYVIFTSGSTGTPKGVVVEHAQLAAFMAGFAPQISLQVGDVVPLLTSLSFDIHLMELLLPLLHGACVAGIAFAHRRDPHALQADFARYQVNLIGATPATLQMLVDSAWPAAAHMRIVCGGEALPLALKNQLLQLNDDVRLWNGYGPTEATVYATCQEMQRADTRISIGRAYPGVRCYVLDAHQQPVPIGASGELWLGGATIARGYLGRDDLSRERFLPDPFATDIANARMYRSGDLARWQLDATAAGKLETKLEILGRLDFQVKLRGQRIELGEIESCLATHPLCAQAVVVVQRDNLVAYIKLQQSGTALGDAWQASLQSHVALHLPAYMQPTYWLALDEFPLTANFKIDRKALPEPDFAGLAGRAIYPPANALEAALASLWSRLLQVTIQDVSHNFFQLGGHSLLAVRLLHAVNEEFAVKLNLAEFLQQPTVRAMAHSVAALQSPAVQHETDPVEQIAAQSTIQAGNQQITQHPLSPVQASLWAVDQIAAFGQHYTIPLPLELHGPLQIGALENALRAMRDRHKILRAVFRLVDGEPQQIEQDEAFHLAVSELSISDTTQSETLRAAIEDAPFDLANGPLLRAHLVRYSSQQHTLLLAFHHMVMDGWSLEIFVQELAALYAGDSLAPLPIQYSDYARHLQQQPAQSSQISAKAFWQATLQDAPVAHSLALDRPRAARPDRLGARLARPLDAKLYSRLQALAQQHGSTLYTVLHAALAVLLARFSSETDVVIGAPVANRQMPQVAGLLGYFANVLPLRSQVQIEQSFIEFLQLSHQRNLAAFAEQSLSFDQIVACVNPPRSLQHNPLFQIFLASDEFGTQAIHAGGVQFAPRMTAQIEAKYELTLGLRQANAGQEAALYWTYASAIFDAASIARMADAMQVLLAEIVAKPHVQIGKLALMDNQQHQTLLALGQGAPRSYPLRYLAQQRVAQLAAVQPDAPALVFETQRYSYAQMQASALKIAAHLRGQQGRNIGIVLGRNCEFILAQLAILHAGAVFVPLDPHIGKQRIATVIEDADISVLLTVSAWQEQLASLPVNKIYLDALPDEELSAAPAFAAEADEARLDAAAYIVFTSGSTGLPKGAVNTHRGLLNLCDWQIESFAMSAQSVMTVSANVSFDSILWEIWPALLAGACLVITPEATLKDPLALSSHLQLHQPSHFWLPTGLMEAVCSVPFTWPSSIRWAFTGGDRLSRYCLPPEVNARLFNLYGPSEAAVLSTAAEVLPDGPLPVPIGGPLPNVALYIVDQEGQLLPRGAVGELCIAGYNVGLGYLNRPSLNAEKYLANPFSRSSHYQRLYRSGDYARWREDGSLDCLGRIDMQVKIRGFRIEPQEVAAELMRSQLLAAVYVDVQLFGGEKNLIAYAVPLTFEDANQPAIEAPLRSHVAQNLPAYMQPARYFFMAQLPLTANGKIDRRALLASSAEANLSLPASSAAAHSPNQSAQHTPPKQVNTASPRDHIEMQIYRFWREVLLQEQIGIRDSFFDVGGSSISAIKVVGAMNQYFALALPVATLFHAATIEALGGEVRAALANGAAASLPTHLIDFRRGERSRNIICIHPGGGTAFCYLSLAKLVPDEIGVFGVQARGVQEGEEVLPTINAMAEHYIELISHLLDKPYVILGASFGGLVAYEMSRILHERGYVHGCGIMLDADTTDDPEILARVKGVSAEVFRQKLVTYNGMFPGIDDAQIARYHAVYNHNLVSICSFAGLPHHGRCVLVQPVAGRDEANLAAGQRYWLPRVSQGLVLARIAGDHSTMLEAPPVLEVVAIAARELAAAQAKLSQISQAASAIISATAPTPPR